MDFLTTTLAQISDLFRSMTPAARMTAALLLAVLVVSLGYLFTYAGTSADEFLLAGESFSTSEIQAMEAAWGKAGLNDYEVVGTRIRVPGSQRAKYMGALLDGNALPTNWNDPLKNVLKNGSYLDTAQDREAQLRIATQETLSLWIRAMAGIEDASVIYNSRTEGGLRPKTLLTAVANVKPLGNATLAPEQVRAIRNTVAGAIPGMEPDQVVVTDTNGRSYRGGSEGAPDLVDNEFFVLTQAYEGKLRDKILDALSWIPGVRVQTSVELDKTAASREVTRKLEPKTVTVASTESNTTLSRVTRPSGGAPGVQANRPPNQATALTGSRGVASQEDEKSSESENVSLVSGTEVESQIAGMTPKRASVAISVPNDYLVQEWRKRNPTPEGQTPAEPDAAALDMILRDLSTRIKETAGRLVPQIEGTKPEELVSVHSFLAPPPEALPETGMVTGAARWFANSWQTLAVLGLVIVSLFMLRSFVKSVPVAAPAEAVAAHDGEGQGDDDDSGPSTIRFGGFGETRSVRDEIAEMIKHDPDAAAAILRTWISSPA